MGGMPNNDEYTLAIEKNRWWIFRTTSETITKFRTSKAVQKTHGDEFIPEFTQWPGGLRPHVCRCLCVRCSDCVPPLTNSTLQIFTTSTAQLAIHFFWISISISILSDIYICIYMIIVFPKQHPTHRTHPVVSSFIVSQDLRPQAQAFSSPCWGLLSSHSPCELEDGRSIYKIYKKRPCYTFICVYI